jgi:hypothetical protein
LIHQFHFFVPDTKERRVCAFVQHFVAMAQGMGYNGGAGENMGKIAGVPSARFAFFVATPLSVSAQVAARDSGDYNFSCHYHSYHLTF